MVFEGKINRQEVSHLAGSALPYQAAIRWVLRDHCVDCCVPGTSTGQQSDELLEAARTPFSDDDQVMLDALATVLEESGAQVAPALRAAKPDRRDEGRPWG